MFTGIVECMGEVIELTQAQNNLSITIQSPISHELQIDQSVAHNGVCLTVVACNQQTHTVTAIHETLIKTDVSQWKIGQKLNLERCLAANARFDGHIVQGHVDTTATCTEIIDLNGSTEFVFHYQQEPTYITVEKGSITVNGVSLTVVRSEPGLFSVHIIPFTLEHTGFGRLKKGDRVNLEFDVMGKYVARMMKGYQ